MNKNNRFFYFWCKSLFNRLVLFGLLHAVYFTSHLQATPFVLKHYSQENGFVYPSVTSITKDKLGYLWISSQDGLSRFDGYQLKTYTKIPNNEDSLGNNFVWDLSHDKFGNLWLAHRNGFSKYGISNQKFSNYSILHPYQSNNEECNAITIDSKGRIWIGTATEGIQMLDPTTNTLSSLAELTPSPKKFINVLNVDEKGLWIGTGNAFLRSHGDSILWRYQFSTQQFSAYPLPVAAGISSIRAIGHHTLLLGTYGDGVWQFDQNTHQFSLFTHLPDDHINAIESDPEGRVWIGTQSGLFIYFNDKIVPFYLENNNKIIQQIYSVYLDTHENLWVGTWDDGIFQISLFDNGFKFKTAAQGRKELVDSQVLSMGNDAKNNLWVANWSGGIVVFDPKIEKVITHYQHDDSNPKSLVKGNPRQIHLDKKNNLWIGTTEGLSLYHPQTNDFSRFVQDPKDHTSLCGHNVLDITSDSKNGLWVTTRDGGACYLADGQTHFVSYQHQDNDPTSLSNNSVSAVLVDEPYGVWFGTEGGGLNFYDYTSQKFIHYQAGSNGFIGSNIVSALLKDSHGRIWVASQGGGLSLLEFAENSRKIVDAISISTNNGLSSDAVTGMAEDTNGNIWIATTAGISFYEPTKTFPKVTRTFNKENNFYNGSFFQDSSGRIYFGGDEGLQYFSPKEIKLNPHLPPVIFTDFKVSNKSLVPQRNGLLSTSIELAESVRVPYDQHIFSIQFSALNFRRPELNQYRYRLRGFDENWYQTDSHSRSATYTNLPHGTYHFEVQGSNNDGLWNPKSTELDIIVENPPWATLPAVLAYLLIGAFFISYFIQSFRQKEKVKESYTQHLKETEERLRLSLWGSGDEFWDWNIKTGEVFRSNELPFETLPKKLLNGQLEGLKSFIHPKDINQLNLAYLAHRSGREPVFEATYRVKNSNNQWIWVLDRGKIVEWDDKGNPLRMAGTVKNINHIKENEQQLNIIAKSLENTSDGVWITDKDLVLIFINDSFSKITGKNREEAINHSYHFYNLKTAIENDQYEKNIWQYVNTRGHWIGDIWGKRANGELFLQHLSINAVTDNNQVITHFIGVFSDITQKKKSQDELRMLTEYDRMTGLLNHSQFMTQVEHHISLNKGKNLMGLIFINLNDFKKINSLYGLEQGDNLLKSVAKRLNQVVHKNQLISRFSADEFAILITQVEDKESFSTIINEIETQINYPHKIADDEINITACLGIALYPEHGQDAKTLLENAHIAMSQLKSSYRKGFQYFNEALHIQSTINHQLNQELQQALKLKEFELYFKPRISLQTQEILSYEIHLRWNSPNRGLIKPNNFIPHAEKSGLVVAIGNWVLQRLFLMLEKWNALLKGRLVSIYLSPIQLNQNEVFNGLQKKLKLSNKIKPQQLEFIIPERVSLHNRMKVRKNIEHLIQLGCQISIQNFGATQITLEWLKRTQPNSVRINSQVVRDLSQSKPTQEVANALITIAKNLSIHTIAEGVQDHQTKKLVEQLGCDSATGPFFSQALCAKDFQNFLENWETAHKDKGNHHG